MDGWMDGWLGGWVDGWRGGIWLFRNAVLKNQGTLYEPLRDPIVESDAKAEYLPLSMGLRI